MHSIVHSSVRSDDDPMHGRYARIGRLACGTQMTYRFGSACSTLRRDPGHLPRRDRAVLRILNRSQAATAAQLAVVAYHDRHVAQVRLRRLWDLGYLERILLPPAHAPGGAPYAYRLSSACLHTKTDGIAGPHRSIYRS